MQTVVLDTAAFIDYFTPDFINAHYYTTPSVVAEIRDAHAREKWEKWKSDITVKVPSPAALKVGMVLRNILLYQLILLVASFAKKTGDHAFLSETDEGVIALTYDLEVAVNGKRNIHALPLPIKYIEVEHEERAPKKHKIKPPKLYQRTKSDDD